MQSRSRRRSILARNPECGEVGRFGADLEDDHFAKGERSLSKSVARIAKKKVSRMISLVIGEGMRKRTKYDHIFCRNYNWNEGVCDHRAYLDESR